MRELLEGTKESGEALAIYDFLTKKANIKNVLEAQTCSSITEELANVSLRRVSRAMVDWEAERSVAAASSRLLGPPV